MNMSNIKNKIAAQDPAVRIKNFGEVELGYTDKQAVDEAQRCLQCKTRPCVAMCPVGVDIPAFLGLAAKGEFLKAYETVHNTNALPAVCGRVCPQETQCEQACVRGIKGEPVGIGKLERFVADYFLKHGKPEDIKIKLNGKKVAVIGSGPAGLTCAGDLCKLGYEVTVFEALHKAGGVLVYGIPEFRLPKAIVEKEIAALTKLGAKIMLNTVIGKTLTIDELFDRGYEAVFIGSGAGLPRFMGIKGEGLNGVYSSNEYLTRVNLMKAYTADAETPVAKVKRVAVIGGGNVAMDAARCAKRMGADDVYVVYRRGEEEMPARREEIHHAKEEGIIFKFLTNPTEILDKGDYSVSGLKCVSMELGEKDASGRRSPREIKGSDFVLDVDAVIMSIGTAPNPLITMTTKGISTNRHGCIVADGDGKSSREGVYAGGDAVSGAATVILAMGAGKKAAQAIDEYIKNK